MHPRFSCYLKFVASAAVIGLCLFAIGTAAAQTAVSGDIIGTVTDPSGAVVSGATVTATSASTGVTETESTNSSGAYRFSFQKPDTYKLSVSHSGFRSTTETVVVNVGAVTPANIRLEVGQTSETVEVSGAAPLLETENANLTTTYSSGQIENLPNGGNDITAYAYSAPGVLMNSSSGGGYGNFTAYGLPATSNLFTVNGNDEMDPYLNLNNSGATNLLLGANEVEEVGVTSNGYTGQYGRMAGAQVNYLTKSGTNSFHGSLKYYYNDVSMNANDWFLNNTHTKPGFDVNNQYAAAIGGPIKKDKLFFFVGTEGLRYVLATSNPIFIPNAAFQSAVLNNLPANGAPNSVPFYQNLFSLFNNAPGAASAVPVTATGFDCGDINTAASGVLLTGFTQFGDPSLTVPGTGGTPCGSEFRSTAGSLSTVWLMYAKVDWNRTSNDRWSIRMKNDHGLQPTYTDFLTPAFNAISDQPAWEGQISNSHTFTPNVINQFIGSVFWYSAIFRQSNAVLAQSTLPYAIYDFTGTFGNPNTVVMAGGEQNVFPQGRNVTQYQLVDDISVTRGNHAFKFGANFRRDDVTDARFGVRTIPRARIFSTTDFASGFIDQFSERFPRRLEERLNMYSVGFYGQDEWRASPKLKLTLALRLDRNSNATCPDHCITRFATQFDRLNHDPTIPFNQMLHTGLGQAFSSVQAINAQPRVGFAYNMFQNTVLRGGVGMFSDLYPGTIVGTYAQNAPFDPTFTIAGMLSPDEAASSAAATAAGCNSAFQNTFSTGGTLAAFKAAAPAGCRTPDIQDVVNHLKNPTYVQWNLELQQSFGSKTAISLNYVGNHGYDEFIYNDLANARDRGGLSGLPTAYPDLRVRNVQTLYNGATSSYHGLTAGLSERALAGLQFSVAYTYSHCLDAVSNGGILFYSGNDSLVPAIDPFNLRALDYNNCDYDVRHNVNANYVWQVPTHFHGVMDRVLGGWTFSGTIFSRSGYPFTMQDGDFNVLFGNSTGFNASYSPLPTFVGSRVPDCSGHNQSAGCFGANAALLFQSGVGCPGCPSWDGTFGHTRRNFFRGPHYFNSDFSVLKNFKFTERVGFGLGANLYNVLNHPNFANPNHDLQSAATAGIPTTTVEPPTSPYGAFVGAAASGRVIQLHAELKF